MRNPNGYGSIYKLSGNRRRPYAVRKTVGFNDKGQPLYKFIGYYETREEALIQLAMFNKNPYELKNMTLNEVIKMWKDETWGKLKDSSAYNKQVFIKHLEPMGDLPFQHITPTAWTNFLAEKDLTEVTAKKIIGVLSELYRFAVRYDLIGNDITQKIQIVAKKSRKTPHRAFSVEELKKVWEDGNKIILSLIYTGLRCGEYLALKEEDIKDGVIYVKESKTNAGVRQVPIPSFIDFTLHKGSRFGLDQQIKKYSHRLHDTRHTYISLLVEKGVDPRLVKKLCGHSANDITDDVYTHVSIDVLKAAVEKLPCY